MLQNPFPAYRGNDKYIFISYAHKDMANVFPAINALHLKGYRIWYDEGIEAGDDWSGTIAGHLSKAEIVIYFMSKNTAGRENIERELACAAQNSIPVLTVMIGNFKLTPQQEKQITVNQYLRMDSYKTYDEFAVGAGAALDKYDVREQLSIKEFAGEQDNQETIIKNDKIRYNEKRKKKTILILVIVIAFLLIVFLVFSMLFRKVPTVIGMKTQDAEQAVSEAGFEPTVSLNYSDEYEFGTIFEQSAEGTLLKMIPIVITQSLGPEENLTDVPDVVGTEISDGAKLLIGAGMKKFTVIPEFESELAIGYISNQSIPAGLRVSRNNSIILDVRTDGGEYTFNVGDRSYTISGDSPIEIDATEIGKASDATAQQAETGELRIDDTAPLSLSHPEQFQMTDAEWKLFNENNKHSIWEPQNYKNIWLPAALTSTITNHPDECYGWVAVRDLELNATDMFKGFSEIYICPGVTVTVYGKVTDTDSINDYYVAPGGTLIFDDEVNGGVYLINDGTSIFKKNLSGGRDGVLVANRGAVDVNGTIGNGVRLWNFYESSVKGTDNTGGTLRDYSPYRQVNAANWYEGCSSEKGFGILEGKLETFAGYDQFDVSNSTNGQYTITPVINPEDYEDHYQEEFYTAGYLFLNDYTVDRFRAGRGQYWELIAAPGITLTIDTPNQDQHAAIVSEEGATVIINSDIKGYWPYVPYLINDGTLIINGKFVPTGEGSSTSTLMNRGTFIANATFGGPAMYCYNFAGSSFSGDILDTTYVQNIDWRPEYVTYDNGPGGALRYQEDVLAKEYGYEFYLKSQNQ